MASSLKELGQIFQPKSKEPETTPSLREAIKDPLGTIDSYYITPSLRALVQEILERAVHQKGQGYWIRAEYGAGKTHFLAALATLLTNRDPKVWDAVHDTVIRKEYQAALTKLKLFPVSFSLLGAAEAEAGDSLVRRFEKQIREALPPDQRAKVAVLSEELAVEWFDKQAGSLIKDTIAAHFSKAHRMKPDEFRHKEGAKRLGTEILKVVEQQGITIDLKGAFRERFAHIYDRIIKLGYHGLLFVVDEFRSWQERHEGKPSFEEGVQLLETLAYYLPVEEKLNILTVVASQGDCPQKLAGAGAGDRFIVRELLKEQTDYGEIVCFRVRDVLPGKDLDVADYYRHCREKFRFLKKTNEKYFQAIFPFQPACFDLLRRVTQSYERYGLPAARSGIHIAYQTLKCDGILAGKRLAVLSDPLHSPTLTSGLRSVQFKSSYESYEDAVEALGGLLLDDQERELARRILGTLYLWGIVNTDVSKGMSIEELAEATVADLEGVFPKDSTLDLVMRLKSDIPQIKYDKDKGVRFEMAEIGAERPERVFGNFKKKGKAETTAQDEAWRLSLFWDFKALEGAGSEQGYEGGFFDGYTERDIQGQVILPGTSSVKATPRDLKVQYGGEVIVADRWQTGFGETWSNKPEIHFRIVYLTSQTTVDKAALLDARIAVCIPAALSPETRENLAELVGCNLMLAHYNDRDHPGKGAFRDWARARRRGAMAAILKNQNEEFRRGSIITQKELGLPANQFFQSAPRTRGKREESLAAQLLEKAYDAPLFNPREFKKDLTDADAAKVFRGLFSQTPSSADTSARDNFGAGLGLVAKNDPGKLAPQPGSAVVRIQAKLKTVADIAVAEIVKELCQPPHGMTEDLIRLAILCAVRAGNPSLVLAELNPSAGFKLANGKEPMGKRLTGKLMGQVDWSLKLEKALLGARLKLSDEKSFNEVLPYAQVLGPAITTATTLAEEDQRNAELCGLLKIQASELPAVRDNLKKLAAVLGGTVETATNAIFSRLETLFSTADYLEFHAFARESYPTPEMFKAAYEQYERAKRLTAHYPDLQSAQAYLDELAKLDDANLTFDAQNLKTQLAFASLWTGEGKLAAILEHFRRFREKYDLAYRKAHRDYHDAREKVQATLTAVDDKLTVIERLNALELGTAVGAHLSGEVQALRDRTRPCPLKINCRVEEKPRCQACQWDGEATAPQVEAEVLVKQVKEAAEELCKRVAQGAIRKVLEENGQPNVRTLLDMITAARVEELARVLTSDAIAQMKGILAAANIEHRDMCWTNLLQDLTMLEEDRIDDFLKKLRERLLNAFDQAKRETEGKKRVRFFLK